MTAKKKKEKKEKFPRTTTTVLWDDIYYIKSFIRAIVRFFHTGANEDPRKIFLFIICIQMRVRPSGRDGTIMSSIMTFSLFWFLGGGGIYKWMDGFAGGECILLFCFFFYISLTDSRCLSLSLSLSHYIYTIYIYI